MIYLWVKDELEMDKFHEKEQRLYRVMVNNPNSEEIETSPSTQAILAEALKEEVPEIENAVASIGAPVALTMTFGDRHIPVSSIFADKDFFTIFSFDLVNGNPTRFCRTKRVLQFPRQPQERFLVPSIMPVGKIIEWQFPYGKDEVSIAGRV